MTINALFYNINTGKIEDYTRQGVQDIKDGIIRTPLSPLETFQDDPLRVLRSIRFAARFGFKCVPELIEAAKNPTVETALYFKISRERVGNEIISMALRDRFDMALELIIQTGLWNAIFTLPDAIAWRTETCWDGSKSIDIIKELLPSYTPDSDEMFRRGFIIGSVLYPLNGWLYQVKPRKTDPVTKYVMLISLKLSVVEARTAVLAQTSASGFVDFIVHIIQNDSSFVTRSKLGMLLRAAGKEWKSFLLLARAVVCVDYKDKFDKSTIDSAVSEIQKLYSQWDLGEPWSLHPLLTVCFSFLLSSQ